MSVKRPLILSCRVTELEMQHIRRQANRAGQTRNDWLHDLVRAHLVNSLKTEQAP